MTIIKYSCIIMMNNSAICIYMKSAFNTVPCFSMEIITSPSTTVRENQAVNDKLKRREHLRMSKSMKITYIRKVRYQESY